MNTRLEHELTAAYPLGMTWQKSIATFHPETPQEIADIFGRTGKAGQKCFISGFGNNIDPVGEKFAELLVLKSDRLNDIIEVGDKDFFVTVGAGYPLKELNKVLAEYNLWFPFSDTQYPGSCGGAFAIGLAGGDGTHTVPLNRSLLSVTAVLPDGSIVTPGAVTFKSVSGYDISRIFFNSWGMLGMLVNLSFRVLPISKRDEMHPVQLFAPDFNRFLNELNGNTPLGDMCRKIKQEYDPANTLPIIR
ncbi:MAG: FAD-binding oxidoreductase [Candidatus Zixiibacteriota bacterium]